MQTLGKGKGRKRKTTVSDLSFCNGKKPHSDPLVGILTPFRRFRAICTGFSFCYLIFGAKRKMHLNNFIISLFVTFFNIRNQIFYNICNRHKGEVCLSVYNNLRNLAAENDFRKDDFVLNNGACGM